MTAITGPTDRFLAMADEIRNSPDLLPPTHPDGQHRMEPRHPNGPRHPLNFALAGDERSDGLPGCRVVAG